MVKISSNNATTEQPLVGVGHSKLVNDDNGGASTTLRTISGGGFIVSSRCRSMRSAVRKVGSATAVLLVGLAGLGLAGSQAASAKTPPVTSPAGSYTATLFAPKEQSATFPLTLTAKGHFAIQAGPKGTWTETGTAITMTGTYKKTTYVFTINQRGTNLGSKAHPGELTADGTPDAKWFAVPS